MTVSMATAYEPSYFSMPGSFHNDGVHPGLIRPPTSPDTSAASSGVLPPAIGPISPTTPSSIPRLMHKRRRGAAADEGNEKPRPAFASTRVPSSSYVLGGSLATPGGYTGTGRGEEPQGFGQPMEDSVFSEGDYRTVLGAKRRRDDLDSPTTAAPTSLFAHPPQPTTPSRGWGEFAFNTIGGVVGKVWNFCVGSKFSGFHAGQGQGYDLNPAQHGIENEERDHHVRPAMPGGWQSLEEQSAAMASLRRHDQGTLTHEIDSPISRASTPPKPAVKRRQTGENDGLGRNWVVINQPSKESLRSTTSSAPDRKVSSPRNRNSGPSITTGRRISTSSGRRSSGQFSASPALTSRRTSRVHVRGASAMPGAPRPESRASFASPRSPITYEEDGGDDFDEAEPEYVEEDAYTSGYPIQESTHRYNDDHFSPSSRLTATKGSHRRTQSNASAASGRRSTMDHRAAHQPSPHRRRDTLGGEARALSRGSGNSQPQSPRLDSEAMRLASKRQKEEKEADVRMAAFNKRLQDMIRQGKEALGTTVDVEMDSAEGAWVDDD